ncbi:MAG: nitroreductase [Clostridiales bacterium GWB2_37_7]|nr:MAG: nitroreductase [Clostridiales bacterium GWB2_37_7]
MSKDFRSAVQDRRTIYGVGKDIGISEGKILDIIQNAVKHTPTAMNSQSGRVIVLLGQHHAKLWDITLEILRKMVSEHVFRMTEQKINALRNGYGTILYFEDQSIIEGLQQQFPLYQENFPIWSHQASGMLQYIIWTELEAEGLGASLHHYNPIIDSEVQKEWDVPSNWKLIAQMPFGAPVAKPNDKQYLPLEDRMKVFK